jgi:uncharacterized protein (TIGR02996 family)
MPRYERKDATTHKFWEIEVQGSEITTRWGEVGTEGETAKKTFPSRYHTKQEYKKVVAERTKFGYLLVEDSRDPSWEGKSNPELEAAIFADPTDDHRFAVYGDWLQANGDPRGEVIALQAEHHQNKAAELIEARSGFFYGRARDHIGNGIEATWRLGFIDSVRVHFNYEGADGLEVSQVLKELLGHRSARFIRSFTIGMFNYDGDNHYPEVVAALTEVGVRHTMRHLFIGDFVYPDENEISWVNVGDVGKIWELYPNLETLRLRGAEIGLGTVRHQKLKSLTLETGGLPREALVSIASAELPTLERLEVWTGCEEYGATSSIENLRPILEGVVLPKLKHLGIRNSEYAGDVARALPSSALLPRLESVDLSMGTLIDADVESLLDHQAAFAHLTSLDLSQNLLTDLSTKRLVQISEGVNVSEQREDEDPEYRFAVVGE